MKKLKLVMILLAVVIAFSFSVDSFAAMIDGKNVQEIHADATVGCTVCHPQGDFKGLNKYGKDYLGAGRNVEAVKAVDPLDSDADGIINSDEINAGTNPGDAASK